MSSALLRPFLLGCFLLAVSAPGCLASDPEGEGDEEPVLEISESVLAGQNLFNNETFGGNGRRCADCHPSGLARPERSLRDE